MTIKIHKFLKSDLSLDASVDISMSNSVSMTISHYASGVKSTEATIPFEIEGTDKHSPFIDDVDFCVVVRKEVDMTGIGVNENEIKNDGRKDVGEYNYADKAPHRTLDLPPGFTELYKK